MGQPSGGRGWRTAVIVFAVVEFIVVTGLVYLIVRGR